MASVAAVTEAPYGEWKSPLSAVDVAEAGRQISSIRIRSDGGGSLFFLQERGDGTTTIFSVPAELLPSPPPPIDKTSAAAAPLVVDVLPPQYSASTRLYEYGGAPYAVLFGDGFGRSRERIVFSDGRDGGLRMLDVATGHVSVVVEPREGIRFGDLDAPDGGDEDAGGRWILAVQEDHTEARTGEGGEEDPSKVKNYVVAIDIKSGTVTRVAEGADFYACPRFAPAAGSVGSSIRRLCWLEWDFPDMPWEGVRLVWAAWNPFGTGKVVGEVQTVAGGRDAGQSAAEPRWSPDGKTLYFALDVGKDWRQLYRVRVGGTNVEPVRLEGLEEVDFGAAAMSMGPNTYGFLSPSTMVAAYAKNGRTHTILADVSSETWVSLSDVPLVNVLHDSLCVVARPSSWLPSPTPTAGRSSSAAEEAVFYAVGASETSPSALYRVTITSPHVPSRAHPSAPAVTLTVIRHSASPNALPESYVSRPTTLAVPAPTTAQPGRKLHGLFFAPHNPGFKAAGGGSKTLPPLIVTVHGGPIGMATSALSLETQYYTTRGYAVLAVNPAGSSPSFGAAHRDALYGFWGVRDADEISLLVRHLVSEGKVDGKRVGITGGSAGGYAVLRALTLKQDSYPTAYPFAAGVPLFGIADIGTLLGGGTHKMESAYGDTLVFGKGNLPDEQERSRILKERSPLYHVSRVTVPLLLLHGDADQVVPLAQAHAMVDALEKAGHKTHGPDADVRLVVFKGEGHGFTRRESLVRTVEESEAWWRRTLL